MTVAQEANGNPRVTRRDLTRNIVVVPWFSYVLLSLLRRCRQSRAGPP